MFALRSVQIAAQPVNRVTIDQSRLFSHLPSADLEALMKVAEEKHFAAGQVIFKEGDSGDGVYFISSGSVQISGVVGIGEREVFAHATAGEIFGEMAVLDDLPRSASATAENDTVVHFIPRDQLVQLLHRSAELSLSVVQEISKRLRDFNRQYVQKVLQAERMALVGRFASSIVHDLKNPLTIIGMAADAACRNGATISDRRASLKSIHHQLDRVTGLVNDILEFTRGGHSTELVFKPTDYSKFILGLIQELQSELKDKNVTIEYATPPPAVELPICAKRLTRVYYNLIGNAVDAMPYGGLIKLRFRNSSTEVVTEIHDSGPGIAAEVLDKIFEAFVTFGKQRGTGLGLSICQRIVTEHQGRLSAVNDPDGGAVFSIALPKCVSGR